MKETAFINQGKVYKTSTKNGKVDNKSVFWSTVSNDFAVKSDYYTDYFIPAGSTKYDPVIELHSRKTEPDGNISIKKYTSSLQARELLGISIDRSVDIEELEFPLCPDINIWGGIAEYEGKPKTEFIELYFNAESYSQMQSIAEFYGLQNPLPEGDDFDINISDWVIRDYTNIGFEFVLGSIVFRNNTPSMLKIYKYDR